MKKKVFSVEYDYKGVVAREAWEWIREELELDEEGYSDIGDVNHGKFTIIVEIIDENE